MEDVLFLSIIVSYFLVEYLADVTKLVDTHHMQMLIIIMVIVTYDNLRRPIKCFREGAEPKQKGAEPRARSLVREGSIPCLIAKCCSGYRTGTEVGAAPVKYHLIPAVSFDPKKY